jgi:hypothetical protein
METIKVKGVNGENGFFFYEMMCSAGMGLSHNTYQRNPEASCQKKTVSRKHGPSSIRSSI